MLTGANPFKAPTRAIASSNTTGRFLEQFEEIETCHFTVEERVQRKRQALKELEYLVLGPNPADGSPHSPACPSNTPTSPRMHTLSPRLRGLFDLRGPGQANQDAIQSCLDYSPDAQSDPEDSLSAREDPGHSEDWVDDDDEDDDDVVLLSALDDRYALPLGQQKMEKALPAVPVQENTGKAESKIPKKTLGQVRRQVSASRKPGRPSGIVMRNTSRQRRNSVRSKATDTGSELATKGMMHRGSWKGRIVEKVETKSRIKVSSDTIENGRGKQSVGKKEKRKALWSIYSVCSELGLSGNVAV